ncbi:uncharacterized protein [Periplaneta americana]|uniref:uncharacterized protein isoform X1 n=1 Tax=Periplaneta americana TaxID=6978 RepID=UPI0037E98D19
MSLTFYANLVSQPSRAVALFLKVNNIPHEFKFVDMVKGEHTSEVYEKLNPFKKVPIIDDNGFILRESVGILRYLCRERNVPDHWYPKDSKQQARVDEYLEWQHLDTRASCAMFVQIKNKQKHSNNELHGMSSHCSICKNYNEQANPKWYLLEGVNLRSWFSEHTNYVDSWLTKEHALVSTINFLKPPDSTFQGEWENIFRSLFHSYTESSLWVLENTPLGEPHIHGLHISNQRTDNFRTKINKQIKKDSNLMFTVKTQVCRSVENYITYLWKNPIYIVSNRTSLLEIMWTWPHRPIFDIEHQLTHSNNTMKDFSHILYHIITRDNITTIEDIEQNYQQLLMPHLHNVHLNKVMTQTLQFYLDQKSNTPIDLGGPICSNARQHVLKTY